MSLLVRESQAHSSTFVCVKSKLWCRKKNPAYFGGWNMHIHHSASVNLMSFFSRLSTAESHRISMSCHHSLSFWMDAHGRNSISIWCIHNYSYCWLVNRDNIEIIYIYRDKRTISISREFPTPKNDYTDQYWPVLTTMYSYILRLIFLLYHS